MVSSPDTVSQHSGEECDFPTPEVCESLMEQIPALQPIASESPSSMGSVLPLQVPIPFPFFARGQKSPGPITSVHGSLPGIPHHPLASPPLHRPYQNSAPYPSALPEYLKFRAELDRIHQQTEFAHRQNKLNELERLHRQSKLRDMEKITQEARLKDIVRCHRQEKVSQWERFHRQEKYGDPGKPQQDTKVDFERLREKMPVAQSLLHLQQNPMTHSMLEKQLFLNELGREVAENKARTQHPPSLSPNKYSPTLPPPSYPTEIPFQFSPAFPPALALNLSSTKNHSPLTPTKLTLEESSLIDHQGSDLKRENTSPCKDLQNERYAVPVTSPVRNYFSDSIAGKDLSTKEESHLEKMPSSSFKSHEKNSNSLLQNLEQRASVITNQSFVNAYNDQKVLKSKDDNSFKIKLDKPIHDEKLEYLSEDKMASKLTMSDTEGDEAVSSKKTYGSLASKGAIGARSEEEVLLFHYVHKKFSKALKSEKEECESVPRKRQSVIVLGPSVKKICLENEVPSAENFDDNLEEKLENNNIEEDTCVDYSFKPVKCLENNNKLITTSDITINEPVGCV